ncbi:MAG TPA: carboxypeptidase-like regulatory domain-containing protein, partial [Cyclobacteriaceae bacterium]|nr:carboxypeptidase-like regulatory domain-containing protein [Cyclobacteriaceae bacterium]
MLKPYKTQKRLLFSLLLLFVFFSGFSQERKLTGRVTDEISTGMPGVNILVKGTANGTVSDSQGNFSINIPASNAVLVFSFVGYLTKEVPAGEQSSITVNLEPDVVSLSEVVVTG